MPDASSLPTDLRHWLRIARKWAWLLIACPIVAGVTAGAVSLALPRVYEGTATLLVKPAQPLSTIDPSGVSVTSDQVSRTYAQLVTQRPVLEQVIKDLDLKTTPDTLAKNIKVTPVPSTTLIVVAVQSTDRLLARDITNTLVNDFIASTKQIQQQQTEQYTSQLQQQIQAIQDSISRAQARINDLNAQPSLTPEQQSTLAGLEQQISTDRANYSALVKNLSDIQASQARSTDNVVVVSPSAIPERWVSPRPSINAGVAAGAGLLLAIALALLFEMLDQTIKSDEELIERLDLFPIGHIPYIESEKRRMGELIALSGTSPVAEAYRTLRTNLLFSTMDKDVKTVVITSPSPAEGKSRTAANLAIVLAGAGYRTVVVDADFRRPSQHRLFGKIRNLGLSNLMLQDLPESELINSVDSVPNLWLITSGPTPPNPSELLGSPRMRELIHQLRGNFDYVIIDTPPVSAVTDPSVVASYADSTILVAEHGRTSYSSLTHSKRALERVGSKLAGIVINKLKAVPGSYYYYTYAGYGYYSREEQGETKPKTETAGARAE